MVDDGPVVFLAGPHLRFPDFRGHRTNLRGAGRDPTVAQPSQQEARRRAAAGERPRRPVPPAA